MLPLGSKSDEDGNSCLHKHPNLNHDSTDGADVAPACASLDDQVYSDV